MKNNYLLTSLILFCCVQMANAQPYQSIFGDSTTQFNVFVPCMSMKSICDGYDDELMEGYTDLVFFRRGNETIINDQTYQIGNVHDSEVITYLREDTLSGKIYSYFPRCNEEYLVCDLSLNVGDTFYFYRCTYSGTEYSFYMIADFVTYLDGKKVIYFETIFGIGNQKVFFMESIGSMLTFFNSSICDLEFSLLLCAYKDEELFYIRNPESLYGCVYNCMGTNINEYSKNKLQVFPNPVNNEFHIQSDKIHLDEIFIYTIQGQCVKHTKIYEEYQKINIASLPAGIYLLKAKDIQGNIFTAKLIKL